MISFRYRGSAPALMAATADGGAGLRDAIG